MTRNEILALRPKELDIAVGEHIKDWKHRRRQKPWRHCSFTWHAKAKDEPPTSCQCKFKPSQDIVQAWPLVEEFGLGLFPLNNKDWACCRASHIYHIEIGQDHYADPDLVICHTAPEAICKMALIIKLGGSHGSKTG